MIHPAVVQLTVQGWRVGTGRLFDQTCVEERGQSSVSNQRLVTLDVPHCLRLVPNLTMEVPPRPITVHGNVSPLPIHGSRVGQKPKQINTAENLHYTVACDR